MNRAVTTFTPPDPPKTRRSTASRLRLLGAAAELFLAHGYNAVSVNDIAERAQLTKGGFYGHFRSKGQLLVAVIRWKYQEFEQSAPFAAALSAPTSGIATMWSPEGLDVRLLVADATAAARHDPQVLAGMAALDAERFAAVAERLQGRSGDADVIAWLVLALASGIGMREAIGVRVPDLARLEPVVERLAAALLV